MNTPDRESDYQEILSAYCTMSKERTQYEGAFRRAEALLEAAEQRVEYLEELCGELSVDSDDPAARGMGESYTKLRHDWKTAEQRAEKAEGELAGAIMAKDAVLETSNNQTREVGRLEAEVKLLREGAKEVSVYLGMYSFGRNCGYCASAIDQILAFLVSVKGGEG